MIICKLTILIGVKRGRMKQEIRKIIYFDRETIRNILQEQNKGSKTTHIGLTSSFEANGEIAAEAKVGLSMPFLDRLSFLFSGKIRAAFLVKKDNETTITSTEISEFEKIKEGFKEICNTTIYDIENSSTFFRVAGGYALVQNGSTEGVDTKAFKSVLDSFDGYDTYKIDSSTYIRFNNSAFVSNYKRNDLLLSRMDLYCIEVGSFHKEKFDFLKQVDEMQKLVVNVKSSKLLRDVYPPKKHLTSVDETQLDAEIGDDIIVLYDVVYASISRGAQNV